MDQPHRLRWSARPTTLIVALLVALLVVAGSPADAEASLAAPDAKASSATSSVIPSGYSPGYGEVGIGDCGSKIRHFRYSGAIRAETPLESFNQSTCNRAYVGFTFLNSQGYYTQCSRDASTSVGLNTSHSSCVGKGSFRFSMHKVRQRSTGRWSALCKLYSGTTDKRC